MEFAEIDADGTACIEGGEIGFLINQRLSVHGRGNLKRAPHPT